MVRFYKYLSQIPTGESRFVKQDGEAHVGILENMKGDIAVIIKSNETDAEIGEIIIINDTSNIIYYYIDTEDAWYEWPAFEEYDIEYILLEDLQNKYDIELKSI